MAWRDVHLWLGKTQYSLLQGTLLRLARARREWHTVAGVKVPVLRAGRGMPLLLVHGFADRGESWLPLAVLLRDQFDMAMVDLPGYGDADAVPTERATIAAQAQFCVGLLDSLGWPQTHMAGLSMGGAITCKLHQTAPERLLSATLIAAAGAHGLHDQTMKLTEGGRNALLPENLQQFDDLLVIAFAKKQRYPASLRSYLQTQWNARRQEQLQHFACLMAPKGDEGVPQVLHRNAVPVKMVYGRHERIVHPKNIAHYTESFGADNLVWFENSGHAPHLEQTKKLAGLLRQWWGG